MILNNNLRVNDYSALMKNWRRDFHKHPELGWLEYRTAAIVAEQLIQYGYFVRAGKEVIDSESRMGVPSIEVIKAHEKKVLEQGVDPSWIECFSGGHTGVVGVIKTSQPGPIVGIRFDMDALPIIESVDPEHQPRVGGFASMNEGVMHACGHDAHTAIGLAVAKYISENRNELVGTYKLIFQPAEEGVRGAKSMVNAGVLDDVDIFLSSHVGIGVNLGTVVTGIDQFLATTKFNVTFNGLAAHAGGCPDQGKNALLAASSAVLNLHGIPRHGNGQSQINVGVLNAGSGRNIIPSHATMQVETRGQTSEINAFMKEKALKVIEGAAKMYDISYEVEIVGEADTSASCKLLKSYIHDVLTKVPLVKCVLDNAPFPIGSEDATYMMNEVIENGGKATYMIIGTELAAGHHHEKFDIDEDVLEIALTSYVAILEEVSELSMA